MPSRFSLVWAVRGLGWTLEWVVPVLTGETDFTPSLDLRCGLDVLGSQITVTTALVLSFLPDTALLSFFLSSKLRECTQPPPSHTCVWARARPLSTDRQAGWHPSKLRPLPGTQINFATLCISQNHLLPFST